MNIDSCEQWIIDAGKAFNFLVSHMGQDEWHRRRKDVVDYFQSIKGKGYTTEQILTGDVKKMFNPIAVYNDWIAWYMYMVEAIFVRPTCGDPLQSARIYPFFSLIGRNLDGLMKIEGYKARITIMLNEKQNQPDTTFYELAVALNYQQNGWQVEFLEDHPSRKTPDLKIVRGNEHYYVECKRLGKVNDYSEQERLEWQKRSRHLNLAMHTTGIPVYIEIDFKVPVEETHEHILVQTFIEFMSLNRGKMSGTITKPELNMIVQRIDLKKVNETLEQETVLANSPRLIEMLIGSYSAGGKYVVLAEPSMGETVGRGDGLDILNEYWGPLNQAYVLKWESLSPKSIDLKAKDIKRHLAKAVNQIPDNEKGIIHIGFETVDGPVVELIRHRKIKETVETFDYSPKNIVAVYCNALQLLSKTDGYDWAETTIFFKKNNADILSSTLILAPSDVVEKDATHWEQDLGI